MNEQLFLKQLRIQLRGLSHETIEDIIDDYEGYFTEARNSGLSEESATRNLGNPFDIAQDIKASKNYIAPQITSDTSQVRSIIVMIALIFLNLTFVLGPVLGVLGAFIGIIISCVVFIISPLFVVGNILLSHGHLFELFFSLVLCGIGILVLPLLMTLGRKSQDLFYHYVKWNKRMIKGEVS